MAPPVWRFGCVGTSVFGMPRMTRLVPLVLVVWCLIETWPLGPVGAARGLAVSIVTPLVILVLCGAGLCGARLGAPGFALLEAGLVTIRFFRDLDWWSCWSWALLCRERRPWWCFGVFGVSWGGR